MYASQAPAAGMSDTRVVRWAVRQIQGGADAGFEQLRPEAAPNDQHNVTDRSYRQHIVENRGWQGCQAGAL